MSATSKYLVGLSVVADKQCVFVAIVRLSATSVILDLHVLVISFVGSSLSNALELLESSEVAKR